jgi:hypothetical protein
MVTISSSIITGLVGLIGVVIGTLIGHYFNQQLSMRNSRKDVLFKKKLEYFEKLADTIEKNIKLYRNSLNAIKTQGSKKGIEKIIKDMKEKRKCFAIMASPLYLEVKDISKTIINFVDVEKAIFQEFEELSKEKNKEEIDKKLASLEQTLNNLKHSGNCLITEMRKEMKIW